VVFANGADDEDAEKLDGAVGYDVGKLEATWEVVLFANGAEADGIELEKALLGPVGKPETLAPVEIGSCGWLEAEQAGFVALTVELR